MIKTCTGIHIIFCQCQYCLFVIQEECTPTPSEQIVCSTGKLPCVLWQPNNPRPTFCEKDLATGRYTLMGEEEDMTATDLIKLYGPKGGWQNRMPNAIHIVQYLGQHVSQLVNTIKVLRGSSCTVETSIDITLYLRSCSCKAYC